MLQRLQFRSLPLRQKLRIKSSIPPICSPRISPSPPSQRFLSSRGNFLPPRRPNRHTRYDPEEARKAKPLFTNEQLYNIGRSNTTKWVIVLSAGGAVIFYYTHLEEVPVSGRKRFMCYDDASVERDGARLYQQIMQEAVNAGALLPPSDRRSRMVNRVMKRLIPASGLENVDWEVHVINSPEKNAFVIPGGKVFVYSGILPTAQTDDGLAAILGHEIAHNLARHQAESMSRAAIILTPLTAALVLLDAMYGFGYGPGRFLGNIAMEFGLARPASRVQESEADFIGLMMMAKSCYDPYAAVGVWQRMEEGEKQEIPQWLSTHPSNSNRVAKMQEWLPKANDARTESGCAATMGYSKDFHQAITGLEFANYFRTRR